MNREIAFSAFFSWTIIGYNKWLKSGIYRLGLIVPVSESRRGWTVPDTWRPRNVAMSETATIAIIYKDQKPKVLLQQTLAESSWRFEFIEEGSIQGLPVAPRADVLAVFFPSEESAGMRGYIARIFPEAEVVGYLISTPTNADEPIGSLEDVPVVRFPMGLPFAHFLLDSLALIHANREQQAWIHGRADDLQTFFDAFVSMVESSGTEADRAPAMNLLLGKILARLHAEECLIYLSDTADAPLHRAYGTSNIRDLDIFEAQANADILAHVMTSGAPLLDNGIRFEIKVPFGGAGGSIHSVLCLPLLYRNQIIGAVEVLNKSAGFAEEDRDLMQMLARPLAVSIHTIQMFDHAERLTVTDDLTKLYNYRYLKKYLEAEVKRCLRYKKKVSLLFIDVDGFKRVNDTFGHLVGSRALSEMGQVLRKILRETDVVARYGGDEFVVVLPETPLNGALVIAERIRKNIEDYEFIAQDLSIHLTISLGIANCPKHTLTAEGLIKKADAAMYRAKELSKNSIKVAV